MAYDPKKALVIQEGFVPSFYFDHLKKLTIGVGHLVQEGSPYYKDKTILKRAKAILAENGGDIKKTNALLAKDPFFQRPKEELMKVFDEDYAYMEGLARKNYPGFDQHPQNVQDSLVNMTFQLGNKPTRWPSFNKALKARDYEEAAYHLADSDWFAVQTPNRAAAVIDRFAYGTEYIEKPREQQVNRTYMRDNVLKRIGENPKHFYYGAKSGNLGEVNSNLGAGETMVKQENVGIQGDYSSYAVAGAFNTLRDQLFSVGDIDPDKVPVEFTQFMRRGIQEHIAKNPTTSAFPLADVDLPDANMNTDFLVGSVVVPTEEGHVIANEDLEFQIPIASRERPVGRIPDVSFTVDAENPRVPAVIKSDEAIALSQSVVDSYYV